MILKQCITGSRPFVNLKNRRLFKCINNLNGKSRAPFLWWISPAYHHPTSKLFRSFLKKCQPCFNFNLLLHLSKINMITFWIDHKKVWTPLLLGWLYQCNTCTITVALNLLSGNSEGDPKHCASEPFTSYLQKKIYHEGIRQNPRGKITLLLHCCNESYNLNTASILNEKPT